MKPAALPNGSNKMRNSYVEMQIKCLNWLLEREKKIGTPDADSYFLYILPLEIRILERRLEAGAKVEGELKRLRDALATKDVAVVPVKLLPPKAEQDGTDQPATAPESKSK